VFKLLLNLWLSIASNYSPNNQKTYKLRSNFKIKLVIWLNQLYKLPKTTLKHQETISTTEESYYQLGITIYAKTSSIKTVSTQLFVNQSTYQLPYPNANANPNRVR
jgi:hypothetical protein